MQKTTLNIHLLKHLGNRPFQCRKCGQRFSQKGNLSAHVKRVHNNFLREDEVLKFSCSQCSCQFKKLASLNGHVTRVHSAVRDKKLADGEEGDEVTKVLEQINALNDSDCLTVPLVNPSMEENSTVGAAATEDPKIIVTIPDNYVEITDFDGRKYLVEHRRDENGRRILLCCVCKKPFPRPSDLLRHRRIHTDERPFKCDRCRVGFRTTNSLKAHLRTHRQTETYNVIQDTPVDLNLPAEGDSCALVEPSLMYKAFGYVINQPDEQQQIIYIDSFESAEIPPNASVFYKQVTDDIPFIENSDQILYCDLQASNFNIETPVTTPIVETIVEKQQPSFTNLTQLVDNDQIYVEGTNLTICQKETLSWDAVDEMLVPKEKEPKKQKKSQSTNTKYPCQYCSKAFRSQTDLQRHIRTHTNEKPFKCAECGNSFTLQNTLSIHLRTHQKDRQTYPCHICDKKFTSTMALTVHKRIHSNVLPYKCKYCEKQVRNASNLRKHERVHVKLALKLGKKPEEVRPRSTKFSQLMKYLEDQNEAKNDSYEVVIKIDSTTNKKEVKSFSCPFPNCIKEFCKPSLLERHKLVHTKEKNYICDICGSRFNQKSAISVHMM